LIVGGVPETDALPLSSPLAGQRAVASGVSNAVFLPSSMLTNCCRSLRFSVASPGAPSALTLSSYRHLCARGAQLQTQLEFLGRTRRTRTTRRWTNSPSSPPHLQAKRCCHRRSCGERRARGNGTAHRCAARPRRSGSLLRNYPWPISPLVQVRGVDENSPDHQLVDEAFARNDAVSMRASHAYEVRFAAAGRDRWIEEVIREIENAS
jgi:hypothetical protein